MLSWNVYLLIYYKWSFHRVIEDGDNSWGFGQTTPPVLLILPAMTIIEEYLGTFQVLRIPRPKYYHIHAINLVTNLARSRQEERF